MKELNRYDFSNGKAFSTFLLDHEDIKFHQVPECDVIALEREDGIKHRTLFMRPDEALILARLLIDAVWQVTEGYSVVDTCEHVWELRDDGSRLCQKCDKVKLPHAPNFIRNPEAIDIELRR